ncbi:MAG: YcaO-like family protein [bacterium]|nr:YcaO-like family protein [bacterium]
MKILGQDYRQAKSHRVSGSHRSCRPDKTLAAFAPFMPKLGITRLANVTGLDCIGIPVYMAIRPNSRSLAVSQGKGIDRDHAKVSALMESVENWHAEWIELPVRIGSYREMSAVGPTIDVTRLPLRSGGQLLPGNPAPWVEGYDLIREQPVWVPYEYVTMNTLLSHSMKLTFFNSSNGLASGNHLLEATLHGLLEVIERDAQDVWGRETEAARQQRRIDLDSVDDPECKKLIACFERAEVDVAVRDLTSSLGFATYECVIAESNPRSSWRGLGVFHGWGCHLSPAVALSRALCEAAQSRLTIISGSRDDNPAHIYDLQNDPQRTQTLHETFFTSPGTLAFGEHEDVSSESFEEDIAVVLDALRKADHGNAIIVDLTHSDLGIPVAKVIVPGLGVGPHRHNAAETGADPRTSKVSP